MRVIAGTAKGTRLRVPPRLTRPSTDRLREALFSILGARVEGAAVLDLFAGTGALGLEALSRGAERARFVESNGKAVEAIRENLRKAKLEGRAEVSRGDVFDFLTRTRESFDLVFADPPYASRAGEDLALALLEDGSLPKVTRAGGLLMLEVETERDPPAGGAWDLRDRRTYGSSAILFYALQGGA